MRSPNRASVQALLATCVLALCVAHFPVHAANLVAVEDPTEQAFTVSLPQGWQTRLGTVRDPNGIPRQWVQSSSPDGATHLFLGDPSIPVFMPPNSNDPGQQMGAPAGMAIMPFQTAQQFAMQYVQNSYGSAPGFRLVGGKPNPELVQRIKRQLAADGTQGQVSSHIVEFEFNDQNGRHRGQLWASTIRFENIGGMWAADTSGYVSNNPTADLPQMFRSVLMSQTPNPQWQQKEQQRNAQRAQQSRNQHSRRMANNQAQFQAHQNMMKQRYNTADQQNQAWMNNQNQQQAQHEQFVRGINDKTVVTSGSQRYEVDAGYNNYYVNPNTQEYVGTDSAYDPQVEGFELSQEESD